MRGKMQVLARENGHSTEFWTIRRILSLVAVLLTLAFAGSQVWTAERYKSFALETLNSASRSSLAFMVDTRLRTDYSGDLLAQTLGWERAERLIKAAQEGDRDLAEIQADAFFNDRAVMQEKVALRAVTVFDSDLTVLARSAKGSGVSLADVPAARERLRARDKAAQRKSAEFLWRSDAGAPLHSLLLPIGGFRVLGFLEIVTDPTAVLQELGPVLGGDLRLRDAAGKVVLESLLPREAVEAGQAGEETAEEATEAAGEAGEQASTPSATHDLLVTELRDSFGGTWATAELSRDTSAFSTAVDGLRDATMSVVAVIFVIFYLIAWLLLRVLVFRKLKAFAGTMQRISDGVRDVPVPATGRDEMEIMAKALTGLRDSVQQVLPLKHMVETGSVATCLVANDGRIVYLNDAARRFCATHRLAGAEEAAALIGRPADLFGLGDAFMAALRDETRLPLRHDRLSVGAEIVDLAVAPVHDEAGRFVNAVMTWTDVTAAERGRQLAGEMMQAVQEIAERVGSQADLLRGLAGDLDRVAHDTAEQATQARTIAGENSQNVKSASTSVGAMAHSMQEMATESDRAAKHAGQALNEIEAALGQLEELRTAGAEVGGVIALITGIAEQTKLLALNATIEAARAGEAGKGFSVVAGEVKKLAEETAQATDRIAASVQQMLDRLMATDRAIGKMRDEVDSVNALQQEMARGITGQNRGTGEISERIHAIAEAAGRVGALMGEVNDAADVSGRNASNVLNAAGQLAEEAENLRRHLGEFERQFQAA